MEDPNATEGDNEKRKRMSTGLYISCPIGLKTAIHSAYDFGYQFIITQLTHPSYIRDILDTKGAQAIGRTDRLLPSVDWQRFVVGELSEVNLDSEIEHIRKRSRAIFLQELGFALHLGLPVIKISLTQPNNVQLARLLNEKFVGGLNSTIWVTLPMVHPSKYSKICEENEREDTWEWWNDFRTCCSYDRHLGLILELPDSKHIPPQIEVDRWIGEPVKALIIPTSCFLLNCNDTPVLPRAHQNLVEKFLSIDVQYIIKPSGNQDFSLYARYIKYLGKKLYNPQTNIDFVKGCEDYIQHPLQPLTEHLESNVYEVFEKDQIKYTTYQKAIQKALESILEYVEVPVVMVVGAGRGPLVQAALNASYILQRRIKLYAIEKNPYAINTLIDRVKHEWGDRVTLIKEDMRVYEPPEKADILVSELLGSFGDNELSPECLDGAQKFLNPNGISIPTTYTSYIAPIQSIKIHNEIKTHRTHDKSLVNCYETPYVVHLVNYYKIARPQALFRFDHPKWDKFIDNERYKRLRFQSEIECVLTGFVGFFDTLLFGDVLLSIHPETHTPEMVSWFPIVFPLLEPVKLSAGGVIEISFWRCESASNVWYEWCLEQPIRGPIMNPGGRSYFIKKH